MLDEIKAISAQLGLGFGLSLATFPLLAFEQDGGSGYLPRVEAYIILFKILESNVVFPFQMGE